MGNQEWTIHRTWQHWVHMTKDEDKQNNACKGSLFMQSSMNITFIIFDNLYTILML